MINSLYANAWHQLLITWIEITHTLETNGLTIPQETIKGQIVGTFLPLGLKHVRKSDGYYNIQRAELVVPITELTNNNITPSTYTSFIEYDNIRYRVIDIINLSSILHTHAYRFILSGGEMRD